MGEERLIEITSTIGRTNDPLWTMGYVTTLNESEVYLLLRYIGSSKYRSLNLCDALMKFSQDYLKSKGILIDAFSDEDTLEKDKDDEQLLYISRLLLGEEQPKKSGRR